ncbi:uncharacterized protein LOC131330199 [Rhododendron vialii]|uniref:uncharacterized protein LOC131330199 n=1 Tax=Rhododendron vialii TaxID=182163 RepID=UPI00265D9D22|nr:uncharacterized protein LOC131330199 [Rhododendron vialii]
MAMDNHKFFSCISSILWCIWLARNKSVFDSKASSPMQVISHAKQLNHSITKAFSLFKPLRFYIDLRRDSGKVQTLQTLGSSQQISCQLDYSSTDEASNIAPFTFHANPCLCSKDKSVLDIFCANSFNVQLKKTGMGLIFMFNSMIVGSSFKSSNSHRDCASIISLMAAVSWAIDNHMLHINIHTNDYYLFQQLRSFKEFPAFAAPLFFDLCFFTQEVHICNIS